MTTLVTGGTGFIGSYVSRMLINRGEKVIVYDLVPKFNLMKNVSNQMIEIVHGDILDLPHLLRTIKKYDVNRVIHLAYMLIDACDANPYKAMKVNILGTNNVFEAARILDLERVVWASSSAVYAPAREYGGASVCVTEDFPITTRDVSVYGACKILNEFTSQFYSERYNLDLIGLRPTIVYGPGRVKGGTAFLSLLIENPARGKPIHVPFSADQECNWIYVKDAAAGFVTACFAKKPKHIIFNLGGETRTLGEAANYVKEIIPDANITFGSAKAEWVSRYDTTRIFEELGFKPKYSLKDGIKDFIKIVRSESG